MTLNDSWGYQKADDNWKDPRTVIRNLITCARDGGNYLLNIGPQPDGGIPPESERILRSVGDWMKTGGQTIYGAEACQPHRSAYSNFTRKGNTLYMHVHFWPPGGDVSIGGLKNKVLSAKVLKTGQSADGRRRTAFAPTSPACPIRRRIRPSPPSPSNATARPLQDTDNVRINKPRLGVGI